MKSIRLVSMAGQDVTHFTSVDHTADPSFFLRFLDEANKLIAGRAWKPAILEGLRLEPGMKVLEVGCGAGEEAVEIAARVMPGGQVTGIDLSQLLISEAVRRASGANAAVNFEIGDVQALRFPDMSFDAVRCERVLMHVPDAARAVWEMARVVRPGGRMVVQDFDWETQFCDSPYKETTRKIALSFCDGIKNGWIGRCLPRLFREAGISDITISFHVLPVTYEFLQLLLGGHIAQAVHSGLFGAKEADLWWTHLAKTNASGAFLYGFTAIVVCGVKCPLPA
ncbi:MAG TPA: methyltransferase domain-containing protein [Candidatus Angelobacter sp.]